MRKENGGKINWERENGEETHEEGNQGRDDKYKERRN